MFFDNASTTKIDENIISGFKIINEEYFYNPGGLYVKGRDTRDFVEQCRKDILKTIDGDYSGDIIFTGSATEANNLAFFGTVRRKDKKILASMGEHPSVYNTALEMRNRGYNVDFISLNHDGVVDFDDFKRKMTPEVDFVSIMFVSNETGAINDVKLLCKYAKSINPNVVFHTDAVQGVGKIDFSVEELGVDLLTMSAHKIHGMKGIGALYFNKKIKLKPFVFGGAQEKGVRSGTENILGIFSLRESVVNSVELVNQNYEKVKCLKDRFLNLLSKSNINYSVHSNDGCSPYIVSISFLGCRAETLLNMLSDKGVFVGNGSACSSRNSGNRILESMSISKAEVESNLRISFSKYNTINEVDNMVDILVKLVKEYLFKTR